MLCAASLPQTTNCMKHVGSMLFELEDDESTCALDNQSIQHGVAAGVRRLVQEASDSVAQVRSGRCKCLRQTLGRFLGNPSKLSRNQPMCAAR